MCITNTLCHYYNINKQYNTGYDTKTYTSPKSKIPILQNPSKPSESYNQKENSQKSILPSETFQQKNYYHKNYRRNNEFSRNSDSMSELVKLPTLRIIAYSSGLLYNDILLYDIMSILDFAVVYLNKINQSLHHFLYGLCGAVMKDLRTYMMYEKRFLAKLICQPISLRNIRKAFVEYGNVEFCNTLLTILANRKTFYRHLKKKKLSIFVTENIENNDILITYWGGGLGFFIYYDTYLCIQI
ncbi:hypothetical protein AGLY_014294 [Aphis glycines]|uniref:Uncharacterized protein n=1 Tax=Aphis glycines TaxID=307491 RepID=A0A6G0T3L0_APHGL|nr:hypothetical protein AGLY_014294 [Aphis glycines]